MSVTADDPRYDEWPSRKPTKYQKEAAKFADKPVEFLAEKGLRKAHRSSGTLAKKLAGAGITAASVGYAAAAAGLLAAAYVVADQIAKNQRVKLGDKINAISQRYVKAQQDIEAKLGVRTWGDVPADIRAKWLSDYKRALATANAQAQGSAFVGVRESYK